MYMYLQYIYYVSVFILLMMNIVCSETLYNESTRKYSLIHDACAAAVSGGGDDDDEEQAHMLLSHDSVVAAARALQQSGVESRRRVGVTQSTRHDRLHVL